MAKKQFKHTCECKHCGNEAEMMVTCSLEEVKDSQSMTSESGVKGRAVCSHCGNEADIWLDV